MKSTFSNWATRQFGSIKLSGWEKKILVTLLMPSILWASTTENNCLFANSNSSVVAERCSSGDKRELLMQKEIKRTIEALSISGVTVKLVACEVASFSTMQKGVDRANRYYIINYPIMPDKSVTDLVAPIMHELAHVYQMNAEGSFAELMKRYSSKHIELEADFIVGLIYSFLEEKPAINEFQNNIHLLGRYKELSTNAHGTPTQRLAAFRNGVFYQTNELNNDIRKARKNFREIRFLQILES